MCQIWLSSPFRIISQLPSQPLLPDELSGRDDPTTNDKITLIEDNRLARGNRPLRFVKHHRDFTFSTWAKRGAGRNVVMTNLRIHSEISVELIKRNKVYCCGRERDRLKLFFLSHYDSVALRLKSDHVKRLSRRKP